MTTSWVYHPNPNKCTSSRTSFLQCSCALCCKTTTELFLYFPCYASCGLTACATSLSSTLLNFLSAFCAFSLIGCASFPFCYVFCGIATHTASSSFTLLNLFSFLIFSHSRHFLYLHPHSPHLKHSTATISCLLIILFSTPHCITLLLNTSNLFWEVMVLFSLFFLFLQLWARCPNPLQLLHNFPLLPSSSSLSLVKAHFSLSKLLINELYYCKDIVLRLYKNME